MSASRGADEPRPGGALDWDRIKALFHEALELDAESRERLLAGVGDSEPALAAEVRSLLAHAEVSGFLSPSPVALPVPSAFEGDRFGPYRILEPIGRGGMGVVYRATRDDESFTKDVAIKMIDPGMRSEEILKRFRAERQILAMLDHPNIARLIDGGTARDGSPYLVMEYVAGRPLLDDCDAHRLGIDRRLALFLTVCDAVQFAHQRLVIHRDLKSDNILVTEDGSPRLLDFGIAKLVSADPTGAAPTVTAPMNRMLTPEYASPEQVRGDAVTVASDVYSLGVILYELLTGSRPLRFTTRTPEEIVRVVTQEDPPLPSQAVADAPGEEAAQSRGETRRGLRRRLTGDLDSIALKALEKEPARRYGSVDQLAQDVRRHLDGLPILARGQTTTYLLSRFVRRHRAAVVTGGLVAASLIAGLAGTSWKAGVATRRFNDVRALAHAVVFDLHDAIATLPGSTKAREVLVDHALRYLDDLNRQAKGDRSLERELGLAYLKIGDVQGRAMFPNLGHTSAALVSYDKAIHLLGEVARAQPESAAIVHDWITVCQRRSDLLGMMGGRIPEALEEALANRGRILSELARRPGDSRFVEDLAINYSRCVTLKGAAGDTLGAFEDGSAYIALAENLFRSKPTVPEHRRGALIANTKMAQLRAARGDRDSALVLYLRAEDLALQAVGALPNNTDAARDLSIILCEHALFAAAGGDIDSAIAIHRRGMRISEQLAAQDPANALPQSDLASNYYEIGTILAKAHRYEEARARFEEAFDRYGRVAAGDSANFESRIYMARSSRLAGESCRELSQRARSSDERSRWRSRALNWLDRSLTLYRELGKAGALAGEDTAAPAAVDRVVAELRGG